MAESFDSWAIVELFGHQKIAGKVTEANIGGSTFLRVDVPETNGKPAFTRYFGGAAIYSMTPTSEAVVMAALKHIRPQPVNMWLPALPMAPDESDEDDECPQCGADLDGDDSCDVCEWTRADSEIEG